MNNPPWIPEYRKVRYSKSKYDLWIDNIGADKGLSKRSFAFWLNITSHTDSLTWIRCGCIHVLLFCVLLMVLLRGGVLHKLFSFCSELHCIKCHTGENRQGGPDLCEKQIPSCGLWSAIQVFYCYLIPQPVGFAAAPLCSAVSYQRRGGFVNLQFFPLL